MAEGRGFSFTSTFVPLVQVPFFFKEDEVEKGSKSPSQQVKLLPSAFCPLPSLIAVLLAKFDISSVRDELIKKYGPQTQGPRVLMLMWEFPPVVTGGGWTAAYHLIRKLREQGSQITILVPWLECLDSYPFGYEVKIISASIKAEDCSAYSGYSAYSEYGLSQERSRSLFYQVNYFTNRVKKISEEQQLTVQNWNFGQFMM